jgi:hypothetical protein
VRLEHILLVLLVACKASSSSSSTKTETPAEPPVLEETEGALKASARANVRFKRAERFNADLAQSLDLSVDEVCLELDAYPCSGDVHRVSLGGSDPYGTGLYEGWKETGPSTPLVVERIVISACQKRVALDFDTPNSAKIFQSGKADAASVTLLYQRALQRSPTEAEVAHVLGLATDVPVRTRAALACFAVLSTSEFLFY